MLAARHEAVKKLQSEIPELKDHEAQGKLIAYGSDQVRNITIQTNNHQQMQMEIKVDKMSSCICCLLSIDALSFSVCVCINEYTSVQYVS